MQWSFGLSTTTLHRDSGSVLFLSLRAFFIHSSNFHSWVVSRAQWFCGELGPGLNGAVVVLSVDDHPTPSRQQQVLRLATMKPKVEVQNCLCRNPSPLTLVSPVNAMFVKRVHLEGIGTRCRYASETYIPRIEIQNSLYFGTP